MEEYGTSLSGLTYLFGPPKPCCLLSVSNGANVQC